MEALKFLSCKKCQNAKPEVLTNCCCFFCDKCFAAMTESARIAKAASIKCPVCNKNINLQTMIDLKDSNKLNLLFYPEKNFNTLSNLLSNLNFCIQFFKEEARFLTQKLEEKEQLLSSFSKQDKQEKEKESEKEQNSLIRQQNEENEKLKELIKQKEQTFQTLSKNNQELQEKKQKADEENLKFSEKLQKQEEKLCRAAEKLKKYKDELSAADKDYEKAQEYIKNQKELKENIEKQLKEAEEKLKNYEILMTNRNNNKNIQTVRPSEFNKNMKPTMNKFPNFQPKESVFQNKENFQSYYEENDEMKRVTNVNKMPRNSKEFYGGDYQITGVQKEYIKNMVDGRTKNNNENFKKRKMENENDATNKSKFDFQKSFGFKQMKFL